MRTFSPGLGRTSHRRQAGRFALGDVASLGTATAQAGVPMGDVISLADRRRSGTRARAGARAGAATARTFFFDLACPFTLPGRRARRPPASPASRWRPAIADALHRGDPWPTTSRRRRARTAERAGDELRLPLVWPERYPTRPRAAMRAAAHAAEQGRGGAVRPRRRPPGLLRRLRPRRPRGPGRGRRRRRAAARRRACAAAGDVRARRRARGRRAPAARRGRRPPAGPAGRPRAVLRRGTRLAEAAAAVRDGAPPSGVNG